MRVKLELPIVDNLEVITEGDRLVGYTVREPDFLGAAPDRWGQIEDRGITMVVMADIRESELEKIPAEHWR